MKVRRLIYAEDVIIENKIHDRNKFFIHHDYVASAVFSLEKKLGEYYWIRDDDQNAYLTLRLKPKNKDCKIRRAITNKYSIPFSEEDINES